MANVAPKPDVRIKRAYLPPSPEDGFRVLVDRLWPRGVRKADAAIDRWAKEVAPSTELRRWFGHDPSRWEEFCRRYRAELSHNAALLTELRAIAQRAPHARLCGARRASQRSRHAPRCSHAWMRDLSDPMNRERANGRLELPQSGINERAPFFVPDQSNKGIAMANLAPAALDLDRFLARPGFIIPAAGGYQRRSTLPAATQDRDPVPLGAMTRLSLPSWRKKG